GGGGRHAGHHDDHDDQHHHHHTGGGRDHDPVTTTRQDRRQARAWRRYEMANRTTELGLLVLVALIVVGAYTLAALGKTSSLPANLGPFLVVVLGLFVLGHVALRVLAPRADPVLLPLAVLLNGLGYVVIVRLNHRQAGLQAVWTLLGMGAFVGTLFVVRRVQDLD